MKVSLLSLIVVYSLFFLPASAQENKIKLSLRNGVLVAASNMYPNHAGCRATTYAGTVGDVRGGGTSLNLTVNTKKGGKNISFQTAAKYEMDLIITFIQKQGRTVRFGIYECGRNPGEDPHVDNIK